MAANTTPEEIPCDQLLTRLHQRLQKRGAKGIRGLARSFRIIDDSSNKKLERSEFSKYIGEIGLDVNRTEMDMLMKYFDKDGDGSITFDEFLLGIRGNLNEGRKVLVHKAFKCLDTDQSGEIDFDEIGEKYNAKEHPKVITGEKTEEEVMQEFMWTFEGARGNKDNKVTLQEFEQYYTAVSSSIDNDEYFALLMHNAWGIDV